MEIIKRKLNKIAFLVSMGMPQMAPAAVNLTALGPVLEAMLGQNSGAGREITPEERLDRAIIVGDTETIAFLLEAGIDPNAPDRQLRTLAMKIILGRDQLETIRPRLALEMLTLVTRAKDFDPNMRDHNGDTILHYATKLRYIDIVEHILELPNIDINAHGYSGATIMHLLSTIMINSPQPELWDDIIEKVLKHPNWNGEAKNDRGQTIKEVLDAAQDTINALREKINAALEANPNPQEEQELADIIISTIGEDDVDAIGNYIDEHPNFDVNWQQPGTGRTLPMIAAATGNTTAVIELLRRTRGYNFELTDNDKKTVFDYASDNRNEDMTAVLEAAAERAHMSEQGD
ncbi:MAG: ankyrin repeat domain-containing protein [Puniceicoccales bacterium]|jgi:ankyrin repeat protein|nr:ankyrin repeat domain-containing protein [Puniceicoccales bacterium]